VCGKTLWENVYPLTDILASVSNAHNSVKIGDVYMMNT